MGLSLEELKKKYGPKCVGQVIRILDSHTLIVSLGSSSVHVGSTLQVYEFLGDLIGMDGENYGSFEFVKAEVEVVRCEPRYCICKTEFENGPSIGTALTPILERSFSYRKNLPVDKDDFSPIEPSDPKIRLGDPVKRA